MDKINFLSKFFGEWTSKKWGFLAKIQQKNAKTSLDFNYVKPYLVMQHFDSTIGLMVCLVPDLDLECSRFSIYIGLRPPLN